MFNETLQDLLTRHGGNYTALAKALDNVVTSNYLSMLHNQKRGKGGKKPPIQLVEKIKEKFGIDPMTGKSITPVTRETSDIARLVDAFEGAVSAFTKALDSKDRQVLGLEGDKKQMAERENWLRQHIDTLTMGFNSLKQA